MQIDVEMDNMSGYGDSPCSDTPSLWERFTNWLDKQALKAKEAEERKYVAYTFTVQLANGRKWEHTHKFKTIYGNEWGYDYFPDEQARSYAVQIGQNGLFEGDEFIPSAQILSVTYRRQDDSKRHERS